jgi:hypothetical protein
MPEFPFTELAFAGRETIREREAAAALECTVQHVENLLISGALKGKWVGPGKGHFRIAVSDWRAFILERSLAVQSRRSRNGVA